MKLALQCIKRFHVINLQRNSFRFLTVVLPQAKKSYSHISGNLPLSNATIGEVLDHAAETNGDGISFISADQEIAKTYSELKNEADKLASGLIASGLKKGDRIALYSPNCYEWPLTQLAMARAGFILVALNFSLQAQELEYCLKNVGCRAVISYDKLKKHDYYEVFNQLIPDLETRDARNLKSDNLPNLETIIMISEENKKGTLRFQDVLNSGNKESDEVLSRMKELVQCDDPVAIHFTSGTTGNPKGAVISHHGLVNNSASSCHRSFQKMPVPVACCQVPLFHIFGSGSVVGTIVTKSTCVFPCAEFDSEKSLKSIEKYKCNTVLGTPTMYIDLIKTYKQQPREISSIKTVIYGAASCPESLLKDLKNVLNDPNFQEGYGSTESLIVAAHEPGLDLETVSKGYLKPCDNVEIKIVDSNGHLVPKNTKGEICTRGYNMFLGYWNDEKKTKEAIDNAKWFHTGDIGIMNDDGWIKIVGRMKDMVIRGGENIYTAEVESFLSLHPSVLEVHICGVPDERLGEELCCWISVKPGMTLQEKEIRNFCKGKISHFKVPRYIMFVEDFPRTLTGKVKKFEMTKISVTKLNL